MADREDRTAEADRYREVLGAIARGRLDNGRALTGSRAQTLARTVLAEIGHDWPMSDREIFSNAR